MTTRTTKTLARWTLGLAAALSIVPAALAARAALGADGCPVRHSDARAECLSEASTRRAARRPTPPGEQPAQLMRNALQRCERLKGPDHDDCVARMHGEGTTTGSVAGGGIYRELVTREVGPVPPAPPSPAPAASPPPAPVPMPMPAPKN